MNRFHYRVRARGPEYGRFEGPNESAKRAITHIKYATHDGRGPREQLSQNYNGFNTLEEKRLAKSFNMTDSSVAP